MIEPIPGSEGGPSDHLLRSPCAFGGSQISPAEVFFPPILGRPFSQWESGAVLSNPVRWAQRLFPVILSPMFSEKAGQSIAVGICTLWYRGSNPAEVRTVSIT